MFVNDPDFQQTVQALRRELGVCLSTGRAHSAPLRKELLDLEAPAVVQVVLYLYRHLCHHEQWLKAVQLLAYALPAICTGDPEIRVVLEEALALGVQVETPEMERARARLQNMHSVSDVYATFLGMMPSRAAYWMWAARVTQSSVALEYGCDHGTHILTAAEHFPDMQWVGTDPRPHQVAALNEQVVRLGLPNARFLENGVDCLGLSSCVGVLDVLEHSVYRETLLDEAESYCQPGGIVVVTVPNGPWGLHDTHPEGVVLGGHINVESLAGLCGFLSSRGRILHAQVTPISQLEGNSSACVVYRPHQAGAGS